MAKKIESYFFNIKNVILKSIYNIGKRNLKEKYELNKIKNYICVYNTHYIYVYFIYKVS